MNGKGHRIESARISAELYLWHAFENDYRSPLQ